MNARQQLKPWEAEYRKACRDYYKKQKVLATSLIKSGVHPEKAMDIAAERMESQDV